MIERRASRTIQTKGLIPRDWPGSGRVRDERPRQDARSGRGFIHPKMRPDHLPRPSVPYRMSAARRAELNDPHRKEETPR